MTSLPTSVRVGNQEPQLLHLPAARADNGRLDDLLAVAEIAGIRPDPWQEVCLRESVWTRPDGTWSALDVLVEVARQNGKGDIKIIRQLTGLFVWREWLQVHTAHEFKTCYEHFRKIVDIVENIPDFTKLLRPRTGIRTGAGDQAIELRSGERIRFIARSGGSGRGMTGDVIYLDEAFDLTPAMVGALQYTLRAVPNPQVWYTSSAPHAHSSVQHALRKRAELTTDEEPRLLVLSWCNEPDADVGDRETWYDANPALGIRIDVETMANEYRSAMSDPDLMREFRREACGIPETHSSVGRIISPAEWERVAHDDVRPGDPLTFAVSVSDDRADASVAVAGSNDVVGVVQFGAGTGWIVGWLKDQAPSGARVAVHESGPESSLVPDLEALDVELVELSTSDVAQACGSFYDHVRDRQVAVRRHWKLDKAVAGASKRRVGDAWMWDRRDSTIDVTPLVSVTLARWAQRTAPDEVELFVAVT